MKKGFSLTKLRSGWQEVLEQFVAGGRIPRWAEITLFVSIIVLAFAVRFWRMEYVPFATDADELAHIFAGQSLYQYGMPVSWSSFIDPHFFWAAGPTIRINGSDSEFFQYVRPWFDHPFVIALTIGGWSSLWGYTFPSIPPSLLYRFPIIVMSVVTLGLAYVLAKRAYGNTAALFSLALLAFSPVVFLGQRMMIGENFLAFFTVLALYLYVEKRSIVSLIMVTILSGMTKLTGIIFAPILFLAFVAQKKYRQAFIYAAASLIGVVALYGVYGFSIDKTAFLTAMKNQSFRLLGWSNPAAIFAHPGLHNYTIFDLSYYLLLIFGVAGLFLNSSQAEKESSESSQHVHHLLSATAVGLLCTIWATSAEFDMLGWYKIPLFIFLGILSARIFKPRNYLGISILLWATIVNNLGIIRFPEHLRPEILQLRIVVGLVLLFALAGTYFFRNVKAHFVALALAVVVFAGQSFYIGHKFFAFRCTNTPCPVPTVTLFKVIKDVVKR